MTFATLPSWQAWLVLLGAGALATALFLIKLRPPRILVPSLSLWQRVLEQSPDMTRWERIRRAISLVVTVMIALALAFAVTRPSRIGSTSGTGRGRTLIVVDSSWSMLARTRASDTRWSRAIAEARRIAAVSDQVAIATTSEGLVQGLTDDAVLVESALGQLSPGGDDTSWPAVPGVDSVHFITDGAVARRLDRSVVVHSVFEPMSNVAITAFDVRPSLGPDRRGPASEIASAYLEVANFSARPQKVHMSIVRGQTAIVDNTADLAAGEAYRQVIPLPRQGDPALHAHVDAPDNALDVDDDGYAWIARARTLSVVVVGDHSEWLRRLLSGDADVRATFVAPSTYRSGREDVAIFDRWAPSTPAAVPAIYFEPPVDTPWLGAGSDDGGSDERRPRWETAGTHAVLRGVDPATLRIDRARVYSSPGLQPIALSTRGTPVVYAGESSGRRVVVVAFGPADSNLSSAPAFPVLIANALDWLARPAGRTLSLRPGLASFAPETRKVTRQGAETIALTRVNGMAFGVLPAPGLYDVETADVRDTVVVNAADPQRSNIVRTTLATGTTSAAARGALERPWWLACAFAAFILAFAEWWTWQRRITV